MPKPPAALIVTWAITYLYAIILWIVEFTHKDFAGKYAGGPIGFWYTIVIGGLIMGTLIGVYLAETLSKPKS